MGFRSRAIKFLARDRHLLSASSSKDELTEFIRLLRPISTGKELIRVGGNGNGGYLVPDDFDGIGYCFSPGVSAVATFEEQLASQYGIKSFMADASVEAPPLKNNLFSFEKKFLGSRNAGDFMRLESWIAAHEKEIGNTDLILQMDIEGSEYDVLIDTSIETLKRFRIMAIEFHSMDMIFNRSALRLLRPLVEKIANEFVVVHIHPNNYKPPRTHRGIQVPKVMEITFLRKDRIIQPTPHTPLAFPHPLDQRNVPSKPETGLPDIWWK